jgi:hypothetical protein
MTIKSPAIHNLFNVLVYIRTLELELIYTITDSERQTPERIGQLVKETNTASKYLQKIIENMATDARHDRMKKTNKPVVKGKLVAVAKTVAKTPARKITRYKLRG